MTDPNLDVHRMLARAWLDAIEDKERPEAIDLIAVSLGGLLHAAMMGARENASAEVQDHAQAILEHLDTIRAVVRSKDEALVPVLSALVAVEDAARTATRSLSADEILQMSRERADAVVSLRNALVALDLARRTHTTAPVATRAHVEGVHHE